MENGLDLGNFNLLDSTFDGKYSYAVDADTITASTNAALQIGSAISNRKRSPAKQLKKDAKAKCGHKPLFGAARKKSWQSCVDQYAKSQEPKPAPVHAKHPQTHVTAPGPTSSGGGGHDAGHTNGGSNKILGMSQGVFIGATVAVVAVIGTVVYFKFFNKPAVAMVAV